MPNSSTYHRYTVNPATMGDGKMGSHLSSASFQQQRRNLSSVSMPNAINLLHANYPISVSMANHLEAKNAALHTAHANPSAAAPSGSLASISLSSPPPVGAPATSTECRSSASSYAQLPKHWLWSSNFLYSQSRPIHEGFLPYSSHLSGFFANKTKELSEMIHPSRSEGSLARTVDLSSSSYCSDDSFDVSDGKVSPVHSQHSPAQRGAKRSSAVSPTLTSKKRNPYSIEELLKPEKRARTDPISFQPSILIHSVDRQDRAKSPASPDNDLSREQDRSCQNNNNITIEVCD